MHSLYESYPLLPGVNHGIGYTQPLRIDCLSLQLSAAHLGQHAASRSALLTYLLCGEAEIKCTMVAEPVLGNVARKFTQYVMKSLNNPPVLSYICRD